MCSPARGFLEGQRAIDRRTNLNEPAHSGSSFISRLDFSKQLKSPTANRQLVRRPESGQARKWPSPMPGLQYRSLTNRIASEDKSQAQLELSRLEENIEAAAVELTPEDLRQLDSAVSKITVHGARSRKI